MFRSKQLHKIHIFKHSRNFSQSQHIKWKSGSNTDNKTY